MSEQPPDIEYVIQRIENANSPCRDCDTLIAQLMGFEIRRQIKPKRGGKIYHYCRKGGITQTIPEYTASLDAAVSTIPDSRALQSVELITSGEHKGKYRALLSNGDIRHHTLGYHELLPHAILLAALDAIRQRDENI